MIYGYARISTKSQDIERQIRDIHRAYPDIEIVREVYTGTKFQGREKLNALLEKVKSGDTIVFESVSRMSRDAEEGFAMYEKLYNDGVNLVFLHEPYINTDTYRSKIEMQYDLMVETGNPIADYALNGITSFLNGFLLLIAKDQIQQAFHLAQTEVENLRYRTREGIESARIRGRQIGQKRGIKLFIPKAEAAKLYILDNCQLYNGNKSLYGISKELGISVKTIYKYENEIRDLKVKNREDFLRYQELMFGADRWNKLKAQSGKSKKKVVKE